MGIINKKHLLIVLLAGVILTGVVIFKPKENIKLDNVILKQEVNNKTMAMYVGRDNNYEEYNGNTFPKGYRLNINKSKCVDKEGIEIENALYTQDNKVGIKSNKSFYCYLYFDEKENLSNICNGSTMEECMNNSDKLNQIKTIENLLSETKGGMYRYQGQAVDVDNNYICFGTSDKDKCIKDTDHYMYRIIGIEESGRIKVIKKEALNETYQWYTELDHDIKFPNSKIYEAIKGSGFLENPNYVPVSWEEKISTNTWIYGDMWSDETIGARQTGEELYLVETGQKDTNWTEKVEKDTPGAKSHIVDVDSSPYKGQTVYYTIESGNWIDTFTGKISLMYLHDYYLSVNDAANCQFGEENYEICQTGWMHLSQNDSKPPSFNEWTMARQGFNSVASWYDGQGIKYTGSTDNNQVINEFSVRPVFYLNASETLMSGLGTLESPFIITE